MPSTPRRPSASPGPAAVLAVAALSAVALATPRAVPARDDTRPGPPASALPSLEPGPVVGCALCSGPEAFGHVFRLALLPDGTLAVLDRDEPLLRLFAADGSALRAFGRRGQGPGEMARPLTVAATARGELVVGDMGARWVHRFRADGTPLPGRDMGTGVMRVRGSPGGAWIAVEVPDWATFTSSVHLLDADLEPEGVPLPTTEEAVVDEEGEPASPALFAAAPDASGRLAVGHGARYRIAVLARDGRLLRELTREVERVPRTEAEMEALREALRRGPAGARADHPEAGASLPEPDPLHLHFAHDALAWDGRGRLWVRTYRGGPDATVFDLFGPEGDYLGEVEVPARIRAFTLGAGTLAGVLADDGTGVERVGRWRLVEAGAG